VILLVSFVLYEAFVVAEPMMPMRIFENRNRAGSYVVMFVVGAAMFGMFYFITFFVQGVKDYSALKTGFSFLPVAFVIGIVSQVNAKLLGKLGPKPLLITGTVLITLSLGLVQFNLIAGQGVFFTAAAIVWLVVAVQEGRRPDAPPFFLPLLVYAGLTLVSAAVSGSAWEGFVDSKQLLMFLMVPIVTRFTRGDRATKTMDVIIAIGAAGALYGIFEFAILGKGADLDNRLTGPLGHWMTYSGVLMLTTCAAVARLTFTRLRSPWPAIAVPALLVALALTNTRNAWIGTFVAICVLLAIRNWRLVIVVPIVATLALVVAPGLVKKRAASIFDTADPANRDRMVMWKIGADMVRDHPVFGVGPHHLPAV